MYVYTLEPVLSDTKAGKGVEMYRMSEYSGFNFLSDVT